MGGVRRWTAALALLVATALIAALAWHLLRGQADGRASLRDSLDRRAALTGKLITSALMATVRSNAVTAKFGGSRRSVARNIETERANGPDERRVFVLDRGGRVLASTRSELMTDASLLTTNPHLAAALAGRPAVSDAFRDDLGRWQIEVAVPFPSTSGRRVLAASGSIDIVRDFTEGFFASVAMTTGAQSYLVDGSGRTLGSSTETASGRPAAPDPKLTAALRDSPDGGYDDRTYVSAPVPFSRWRFVVSVPSAALYASVDGGPSDAAWELFAAFSVAICGLLGLGFAAARSARRLTAATERERAARDLAHERLHDALTGVSNRTLFQDRAEHAISSGRRRHCPVGIAFMDIDHFKRINDSLGHDAGDAVLREVARRLDASVRAADTVGRLGGDEFVVLCEDADDAAMAALVARVKRSLATPILVAGREVPVSVSIGVAMHDGVGDARTASELVRDADTAMYRAKQRGRGGVEIFDGELHQQAVDRLEAEVALRHAIEDEEFELHYQPIVDLVDGGIHGVEALVRWRRADTHELVGPGEFIPLAEETGLIVPLGEWVLRTAVLEVGEWVVDGLVDADFELSVNVSARQLGDPRLPEAVAEALAGWDHPPGGLCLEITESAVTADHETAERMLEQLDALGVRLAIDDFGVGHSSLGQLARAMPISVLKLDRSFVAGMTEERDRGIVEAAASLARALRMSSVAEGVESADQASQLAAMGFSYAQGFHFGRPMASAQIAEHLARYRLAAEDGPRRLLPWSTAREAVS